MSADFKGHVSVTRHDGSTADAWHQYTCGHCGTLVSGAVVASKPVGGRHAVMWLWCPSCAGGSVQSLDGQIYPGTAFGPEIEGLPDDVKPAYLEARRCMSVNAHTAAELICRKILMHVAVDKGAKEGQTFEKYITHLADQGYVTPPMQPWVDLIRQHGNQATHKLDEPDKRRAESTVMFAAELLRLVYEMAHLARQYTEPADDGADQPAS